MVSSAKMNVRNHTDQSLYKMATARDRQPKTLQAEVLQPFQVIPPLISRAKLVLHILGCKSVIRESHSKFGVYVKCWQRATALCPHRNHIKRDLKRVCSERSTGRKYV